MTRRMHLGCVARVAGGRHDVRVFRLGSPPEGGGMIQPRATAWVPRTWVRSLSLDGRHSGTPRAPSAPLQGSGSRIAVMFPRAAPWAIPARPVGAEKTSGATGPAERTDSRGNSHIV